MQTITATAGPGFNPGVPFVISGSALAGDGMQAVILDARALPEGSNVQVDNVDFLAVVGAVRITGAAFLDNKPLVGEVIRALDAGISAQSLAQLGLQLLGAQTPGQVTQLLWTSVVGSAATPAPLQPFINMLAQGVTGGELALLASHRDLTATRIDLVGMSAAGIEFA